MTLPVHSLRDEPDNGIGWTARRLEYDSVFRHLPASLANAVDKCLLPS